MSKGDLIIGFC